MERRRWAGRSYGKLGVTGAFAVGAVIVILIAGWLVGRRSLSGDDRQLAELARRSGDEPVALIARAARASRLVFLSDIDNSPGVKRLAARALEKIVSTSGLDAVVVEIGADQQPYIDHYFDRAPEDASVLLSHPRALGDPGGATRAYLDLFHTIWKLNEKLGADEKISVIAADLPGWPPANPPSPAEVGEKLAAREAFMLNAVNAQVLDPIPDARILFFVSGLHALKSGSIAVRSGGSAPVDVVPLAARMAAVTPEVYSILVDAPATGVGGRDAVSYSGTRIAQVLDKAGVKHGVATPITRDFDYLRRPIVELKSPGIDYDIAPREYTLRAVADAYINLH